MSKLASIVVLGVLCQLAVLGFASPQKRDTAQAQAPAQGQPSDAAKVIDDTIDNIKTGFETLAKQFQENELLQNLTATLQNFGESIAQQGRELVKKVQDTSKTPTS